MPLRILILVHEKDRFEQTAYMMREMALSWKASGFSVDIQQGLQSMKPADVAILHVDLTRIPEAYLEALRAFRVVINGQVAEISKHRISENILRRPDKNSGPVMVKTKHNCGGIMEARLVRRGGGFPKLIYKMRQLLPWSFRCYLEDYPIFESSNEVPFFAWHNRDLIVERFLPEREGDYYCLRTWVFLGDRETNSKSYSDQPVIKSANVIRREPLSQVPDSLRLLRQRMGFDFGKFDYGLVHGQVVLYDVNRTPTMGAASEGLLERMHHLSEGIKSYL